MPPPYVLQLTVYKVLTMYFFHQRFIEALKLRAWHYDKSCYQISQLFALYHLYSNTTCLGILKGLEHVGGVTYLLFDMENI